MLPLTVDDALAHAHRFPLVMVWTTVRQGGRSFAVTADLGITVALKNRKKAAVRIAPTAYIPPGFPCPELSADGLCGIHADKPQRCRTMPFSAYRDAADQDDLMIPRPGWLCDTSTAVPVIYRDKRVVDGADFKAERDQLVGDALILQPYAEWLLDSVPDLRTKLLKAAMHLA